MIIRELTPLMNCAVVGWGRGSLLISMQRPWRVLGVLGELQSSLHLAAGRDLDQDDFSELGHHCTVHEDQMK